MIGQGCMVVVLLWFFGLIGLWILGLSFWDCLGFGVSLPLFLLIGRLVYRAFDLLKFNLLISKLMKIINLTNNTTNFTNVKVVGCD